MNQQIDNESTPEGNLTIGVTTCPVHGAQTSFIKISYDDGPNFAYNGNYCFLCLIDKLNLSPCE